MGIISHDASTIAMTTISKSIEMFAPSVMMLDDVSDVNGSG